MYPQSGVVPSVDLPLIRVRGLNVTYDGSEQAPPAVADVDFNIAPAEIIGLLGESGSGKSTLALSIMGLLPAKARVRGSILLSNAAHPEEDLLRLDERRGKKIRGAKVAMIFQEPSLALSPVMRVGDQIAEVLRAHGRSTEKKNIESILRRVRLADADRVYRAYPHQLSGGELHRIVIAQALACKPDLVIADEPTRSLDVTVQKEILQVLREVNRESGSALIFITHNPALLVDFADRAMVMYAGRIVEDGSVAEVFRRPLHPYTKALLQLAPRRAGHLNSLRTHLQVIPGGVSDSDRRGCGCEFEPRCGAKTEQCRNEVPGAVMPEDGHRVSCFNHGN